VHLQGDASPAAATHLIALGDRDAVDADDAHIIFQDDVQQRPFALLTRKIVRTGDAVDAAGGVVAVVDILDLDLEPSASAGDPTEEDAAVGQVGRVDVGLEFTVVELLVGDQVAVAVVRDQDPLFVDGPRGRALVADGPAVEALSIEH
jgi:hypothetical protein